MKFFRRFVVAILCIIVCCSIASPVSLAAASRNITVDYMLEQLENGNAVEFMSVHDFSDLSPEEIEADPALKKMVDDIYSKEYADRPATRVNYREHIYGTYYIDTIIDPTGATLKYYLAPRLYVEYGDIPQNGSVQWSAELYVSENVVLNGQFVDGYMNRIKLKNIKGAVGAAPDALFSKNVTIRQKKEDSPGIEVNVLGIFNTAFSLANFSEAAVITNLLANFAYTNGSQTSEMTINNKTNLVGVKFDSDVEINSVDEELVMICSLGTADTATIEDAKCFYSFYWTFDVYKGSSKFTNADLTFEGSVLTNAV